MVEDGNEQTCLIWPGHRSLDQSRQHDLQLQHPRRRRFCSDKKDLLDERSNGVESIYWAGVESDLMDIYNFPGVIYAKDGSKGSTGMEASTHTIPKEAGASGWVEVPEAALPVGPNLWQQPGPRRLYHPRPTYCGPYRL